MALIILTAVLAVVVIWVMMSRKTTIEQFAPAATSVIVNWSPVGKKDQLGEVIWTSLTTEGVILAVNRNNQIFRYQNGSWTSVQGCLTQIQSRKLAKIVGLDKNLFAFQTQNGDAKDSSTVQWNKLNNSGFTSISIGYDDSIFLGFRNDCTARNDCISVPELANKDFFYLTRFVGQERLGFDGKQLYMCSSCQTANGILGLNERFSL